MPANAATIMYNAVAYLRLSKEDGDKTESDSISNQRDLISNFVKAMPEIRLCSERIDDGFSGVDFSRPAFKLMMEDVKAERINCIIVKDLSRFGRNYIEAGRYIERIFPFLNVRFIAITDGYDSAKERTQADELIIPFKNLVNDAYCRDISVKIRSQLDVKRKKGQFIGAFAVYGYLKSEEDKNQLIIDPYAAKIVRDIFAWKLDGLSQQGIADRLNEISEPSPLEYKRLLGLHFTTSFQVNPKAKWTAVAIGRILKNPIYAGHLVQGKESTPNYKIKQRFIKPEHKWIRVENTHEPIILQEVFDTVNRVLALDTRIPPAEERVYPFSGLIFCADCKSSMVRKTVPAGSKKYAYYCCSKNKAGKGCTTHCISEKALEKVVLQTLQNHIASILNMERMLLYIEELPMKQEEIRKINTQLLMKKEELEKYKALRVSLYEDWKSAIIDADEYREFKDIYEKRCAEAEKAAQRLKEEIPLIDMGKGENHVWLEAFKQNQNITELSRKVLVSLIERINVYVGSRVEIQFWYPDEYEQASLSAQNVNGLIADPPLALDKR
ncbi:recombinase family protein [Aminipila butyrica]|uniref:Recombinase family protein n=1 Tax=Aminipila butyrica TaxID=433296 RepID=A0A858BVJ1_9FIRM|nr:recombinase family protein [Aminipila butyrica]QIB69607.1 recombinase family protein [Aminipila butyrica]